MRVLTKIVYLNDKTDEKKPPQVEIAGKDLSTYHVSHMVVGPNFACVCPESGSFCPGSATVL